MDTHNGCTACLAHTPGPFQQVAEIVCVECNMLLTRRPEIDHDYPKDTFEVIWGKLSHCTGSYKHDPETTVEHNMYRAWLRAAPKQLRRWLTDTVDSKLRFKDFVDFRAYRQMSLDPFLDPEWYLAVKPGVGFDLANPGVDAARYTRAPDSVKSEIAKLAMQIATQQLQERSRPKIMVCIGMLDSLAAGLFQGDLNGVVNMRDIAVLRCKLEQVLDETDGRYMGEDLGDLEPENPTKENKNQQNKKSKQT